MGIVGWAQSPDPEPCANVADILAGLGIGQGDSSLPSTSIPAFLQKFGLTASALGDDDTGFTMPIV
jgi:hypothetical protein